jgi:hypothetical protein
MISFISCFSGSRNTCTNIFRCSNQSVNLKRANTIVFNKLNDNINYNAILENHDREYLHIVFDKKKNIISINDNKIIKKKVNTFIHKSISALRKCMSNQIVKIINDILCGCETNRHKVGCIAYINETPYVMIAFPIIESDENLIGFLFTKKIFDESMLNHDKVLDIPINKIVDLDTITVDRTDNDEAKPRHIIH